MWLLRNCRGMRSCAPLHARCMQGGWKQRAHTRLKHLAAEALRAENRRCDGEEAGAARSPISPPPHWRVWKSHGFGGTPWLVVVKETWPTHKKRKWAAELRLKMKIFV